MASLQPLFPALRRAGVPLAAQGTAFGLMALGMLALLTVPKGPWAATALNTLNALAFLVGAGFAFLRSGRYPSSRIGWRWVATGLALIALGSAQPVFAWILQRRIPPFPSLGDYSALLSVVCICVGLALWPLASAEGSERLRRIMDALGVGGAALFLSWALALEAFFRQSTVPLQIKVVTILFMVMNATVLGFVGFLASGNIGRLAGTLGWVGLTFLISTFQVLLQVPLGLENTYYLGHPVDLIVLASACTMLLGTASTSDPAQYKEPRWTEVRDRRWTGILLPVIPMVLCALVGTWLLVFHPERMDRPLLILGAALMLLLASREVLALRDLQNLSQSLEHRVEERTQALELAQSIQLKTLRMNAIASLGAGLAHDLNNLLGVIQTHAELAEMALEQGKPAAPREFTRIKDAATRAGQLTGQLMAFGRQEGEAVASFDLAKRIAKTEPILRMVVTPPGALELDLGSAPLPVRMEPAHLDQILLNLVSNAHHAMPQGGLIRIRARRDELTDRVQVEVRDQGVGMPPDIQARLFEPFFTTKEPGRGTGLGLSSVKVMLDQAGGTLEVLSAPGRGTTIRIWLPLEFPNPLGIDK